MICRPVFSSSPSPKSATSTRSRSAGVMTRPACLNIAIDFSTGLLYSPWLIIRLTSVSSKSFGNKSGLPDRAARRHQFSRLLLHSFAACHQNVLRASHTNEWVRTQRLVVLGKLLLDRCQINLLENSAEVDLGNPQASGRRYVCAFDSGAAVQHQRYLNCV